MQPLDDTIGMGGETYSRAARVLGIAQRAQPPELRAQNRSQRAQSCRLQSREFIFEVPLRLK